MPSTSALRWKNSMLACITASGVRSASVAEVAHVVAWPRLTAAPIQGASRGSCVHRLEQSVEPTAGERTRVRSGNAIKLFPRFGR
jgi:hypothetical protein